MTQQRDEHRVAIELGRVLANSEELLRLREAQAALQIDKHAMQLFQRIKTYDRDTQQPEDEIMEKAMANPTVAQLVSAQQDFNRLLREINGIIGYYVTAEENVEIRAEGCNGCSGCRR